MKTSSSKWRGGSAIADFFGALLSLPVILPLAAVALSTMILSPIFLIVQSRQLWGQVASRLSGGASGMWEVLAVMLGPALVVGFILGRVVFGRLSDKLNLIGGIIGLGIPAIICIPVIIDYWWYPLVNLVQMIYTWAEVLYSFSSKALEAYWLAPLTTVSITTVAFGWALFAGQIRD